MFGLLAVMLIFPIPQYSATNLRIELRNGFGVAKIDGDCRWEKIREAL
ncbi:hypothetical protein [Bifidobacterium longum]|nr:hypothetical protein [Bifidobacterium longum]